MTDDSNLTPDEIMRLQRVPREDQDETDITAILDALVPFTPEQEHQLDLIIASLMAEGVPESEMTAVLVERVLALGDEALIHAMFLQGAMRTINTDPDIVAYLAATARDDVDIEVLAELMKARHRRHGKK